MMTPEEARGTECDSRSAQVALHSDSGACIVSKNSGVSAGAEGNRDSSLQLSII